MFASCIHIRVFALTPFIQGKSRMRETRSYGSVRGVLGNRHPYRDPTKPCRRRGAADYQIGFVVRRDKPA